jgi:hypothetical protein
MDHRGEFRRAALERGIPGEEISGFGRYLREAVGLAPAGEGARVGQVGGLPRLPVGAEWPSAGEVPLPFLLSVDCGALPRSEGAALPEAGTLLFFVDQERDHEDTTGQYARVLYVPEGTETALAEAPASVRVREQYGVRAELRAELPLWLRESEDEDWHEYWEDLEYDEMSPLQQELARHLEHDLPHAAELRALAREIWPGGSSLVLDGYADEEVIRALAEQTLVGRELAGDVPAIPVGKWPSLLEREQHRLTTEWTALLREARSYEEYATSFVIRREDLAAGRVDKALPVTGFPAP